MNSTGNQTVQAANMRASQSFLGSRRAAVLAGAIIAIAGIAAYANSLSGSFVFLDVSAIVDNPTIRHLWPLGPVLSPPADGGLTVGGRPLVNLSLALNYALSGTQVWSYHVLNLLVHILAGMALFGIARPMLARWSELCPADFTPFGRDDERVACPYFMALAVAVLWTVHPLQTESVTYIIQRAESLMGLFYLLTLYFFIRGAQAESFTWFGISWLACLLGMASKEVMVSAPVIVFLYDRTFLSGSFAGAWRRHGRIHLALAATWILLAWLVIGTGGNRGGTSGFGLGISWWTYACTQFPAIFHYLRLAVWPHPLVFYYEVRWSRPLAVILPYALIVAGLAAATLVALWRQPAWGFLGAWFFAILAPTSLVPGLSQTLAEHRMYLALAPVVVAGVISLRMALGRRSPIVLFALAACLAWMTARRNRDYRSDLALWSDTVAKSPDNPYTQSNLGLALAGAGRVPEAIDHFNKALKLNPGYAEARNNLGLALASEGRLLDAVSQYETALQLKPGYPEAQSNLGVAMADLGRYDEAIVHFQAALALMPGYADARNDLAVALASTGRTAEAIVQYREVLKAEPGNADTHYNLANALFQAGQMTDAITEYEAALRLNPGNAEAHTNLGALLANANRMSEAIVQYQQALALAPNDPDVHYNLGLALRALGREDAAAVQFGEAERLRRP
jgi:tetratricopeptide (TPR) repeat protein